MRTTTAYFAGVGTVGVAIAAGLGGGLLFANMVAPHQPKYATEPTKLELRMSERTIPVTSAPSEPAPANAAAQPAAPIVAAVPAQTEPQPRKETPAAAPPVEQKAASNAAGVQPATSTTPSPAPAEQAAREPAASPREAFAKARDADLKRAVTEKRRAERHQQWADKRRVRQPREQELEAVEQAVRDDTEPRQAFATEPVRLDISRIKLFGDD
jgi:hypothetical protein